MARDHQDTIMESADVGNLARSSSPVARRETPSKISLRLPPMLPATKAASMFPILLAPAKRRRTLHRSCH